MTKPVRLHVRPPHSTPAHRRTLRELVRAGCENKPGTYRMLSESGTVVYVGQSRKLRTRLLSYFRAKGSRNKAARILRHAFQIEWEYAPTEFGALLNELRLIKLHRPHFNRLMVTDDWPRGYIAITGGAVPGIRVVAQSDYPNAVAMYGPFRKVFALREAAQVLATLTGVRDCSIDDHERGNSARALWFASDAARVTVNVVRTSKQMVAERVAKPRVVGSRTPGCLRHDLGTCAAPCIGRGDSHDYYQSVAMAKAFLEGATTEPLDQAHAAMHDAANNLEFERAASLRDRIAQLTWLQLRLQAFHANVDRLTFRYHALAPDGTEYAYLVRRGTVRAEGVLP
ncbi:MAG: UvrB/UvrC motif-containing protein, partial [Gemmatimonadaceae bacterium]